MSSPSLFLDGKVTLYAGDCLDVLKTLEPASIDACVTDPPYGLGFMGKAWDHGVPGVRYWKEVYRVLKPGAHLVSFAGTRTHHRMACAIEDAGFEIRDLIAWMYGSGFPKSHDVSKGIDRRGGVQVGWFGPWLKKWRAEKGIAQKDIAALFPSKTGGKTGCVANWELGFNLPTPEQFNLICATFGLPFAGMEEAEREVLATVEATLLAVAPGQDNDRSATSLDITAPATDAARQWSGWGTALKPALEPICFARKPLIGTVAENVLRHGTGAINIDGCRVAIDPTDASGSWGGRQLSSIGYGGTDPVEYKTEKSSLGRWPANVVHDGSEEVVGAFPDAGKSSGGGGLKVSAGLPDTKASGHFYEGNVGFGDSGSAARFFYTAKADADDRLGSKHPTVKPLDLMQWLVRLVTPKGGTVIDPFAGTGTTGEAAWREGCKAILIEREEEYQRDIAKRMELALAGPRERKQKSTKQSDDAGPLFAGVEA